MNAPENTPPPPPPATAPTVAAGGQAQFPCGDCGAKLVYEPGTTALTCPYCGGVTPIAGSDEAVRELDLRAQLAQLGAEQEIIEHRTLKCGRCAAEFDRDAHVTATACPYCGADIVATESARRQIKPKSLLPFAIERRAALDKFHAWLAGLWFAPSDLKRYARRDAKLTGVYCPYWTYDSNTVSDYSGWRGEHYWVTVGSGKNRRRVRRTRWYPASGTVRVRFDDVLVNASESLPRRYADALEPWDLASLTPYDDAYLSGFTSESYQIDLAGGFTRARQIMDGEIRLAVHADIGGDEQRIDSVRTRYNDVTFKHILLPIWISAYRYRERVFRFLINGRSGEVQGERPWSWVKITLAVLGGLAIIGGAIWLLAALGVFE